MKKNALHLALLVALTALVAAGCARKTAATVEAGPMEPASPKTAVASVAAGDAGKESVVEAPARSLAPPPDAEAGLQPIHFEFDRYLLSPQARDILVASAAYLKSRPEIRVVIDGHCDERGADEYNLALGDQRAVAAKNFLISLGVPPETLSTISYGEENPLDSGHHEEAWAKNRRAEFKIIPLPSSLARPHQQQGAAEG